MEWDFIKNKPDQQVDTVGNILQRSGAIVPNACQKCSVKFSNKLVNKEIKSFVPVYRCSCGFEKASGDAAFDHMLINKTHNLKKVKKERVVKVETVSEGEVPHITKTEDDVIILCSKCKEE